MFAYESTPGNSRETQIIGDSVQQPFCGGCALETSDGACQPGEHRLESSIFIDGSERTISAQPAQIPLQEWINSAELSPTAWRKGLIVKVRAWLSRLAIHGNHKPAWGEKSCGSGCRRRRQKSMLLSYCNASCRIR